MSHQLDESRHHRRAALQGLQGYCCSARLSRRRVSSAIRRG